MLMAKRFKSRLLDIVGLQTPRGRLACFTIITLLVASGVIFKLPNLSLFSRFGIPSPSIGLTRAYGQLLHGHMLEAWQMNPLIFPVVASVLCIIVLDINRLLAARHQAVQ
jgi:hypothetical protein